MGRTMLSPRIMLHQKRTLLSSVFFRIHLTRWIMTIGICSIMAMKP